MCALPRVEWSSGLLSCREMGATLTMAAFLLLRTACGIAQFEMGVPRASRCVVLG